MTQVPTVDALIAQITMATDAEGNTAAVDTPGFPFGPYLRWIPENPINGSNSFVVLADGQALPVNGGADDGWIFRPDDVVFKAGSGESDSDNQLYFDY